MPDLQPDTSLYGVIANNANSGPLARMGLGDLLNLAQQSRALTTQSGIANAISANTQNGQTDYGAATQQAAQTPGVFLATRDASLYQR